MAYVHESISNALRSRALYSKTVPNLKIGSHTRVIFQGFTGRQATLDAKQSLEYGTNIVGGVTPGKNGEHLGLPVVPDIQTAKKQLKPDASIVYVAAAKAANAIEQAIEAKIPLIVAVAEHIPIHDMLRIHEMLRSQSRSRLVGANSPGMISPVSKCRLGFHPIPFVQPGSVGIVAKSGTLSYETIASTTRAGVGQSLVVGIGGDPLPGTNFVDVLQILEEDDDTKGIILAGEIGGYAEEEAAEWIKDYRRRTKDPKPILALVGGMQAPQGRIMGHAGALFSPAENTARAKAKHLEDAGALIVNHPSKFGSQMAKLLQAQGIRSTSAPRNAQIRQTHQTASRSTEKSSPKQSSGSSEPVNSRQLYLLQSRYPNLPTYDIASNSEICSIAITLTHDLRTFTPTIRASQKPRNLDNWNYLGPATLKDSGNSYFESCQAIAALAKISQGQSSRFVEILQGLKEAYFDLKLRSLSATISYTENKEPLIGLSDVNLEVDDAASRAAKESERGILFENVVQAIEEDNAKKGEADCSRETKAKADGIVYVKLEGDGNIGILVNGAGLAMNTVDAITDLGGRCANFLDTGGKATSETVKQSFQIILEDDRVSTIFVNIFGGLTQCNMIAEGIIMAYKDLSIKKPVVVRLRGTNEAIGQKLIAESGLPLHAFDDFDAAAQKAIDLSKASIIQ